MTDSVPWYPPGHKVGIPRQRVAGEAVWRLRSPDGQQLQVCD